MRNVIDHVCRRGLALVLGLLVLGSTTVSQAQQSVGQTYIMTAEDFDLQTVMSLVNPAAVGQGALNMSDLETIVNDPRSGINNVDIDQDGYVDYVGCLEQIYGQQRSIDFVAYPSSDPSGQPIVIASISLTRQAAQRQIVLRGAYPPYVFGYAELYYFDTYYYSYGYGHRAFLSWWFDQTRTVYVPVYHGHNPYHYQYRGRAYYQPRIIIPLPRARGQRRAFHGQRGIQVIPRQRRPHNYRGPQSHHAPPPNIQRYHRPRRHYVPEPQTIVQPQPSPRPNSQRVAPPDGHTPRVRPESALPRPHRQTPPPAARQQQDPRIPTYRPAPQPIAPPPAQPRRPQQPRNGTQRQPRSAPHHHR
ncbi:MAG: hypothetical protein V1738_02315 [Patescibacteria group bacterium]